LGGYNWITRELWLHQLIDVTAKVPTKLDSLKALPIFFFFLENTHSFLLFLLLVILAPSLK